MNTLATLSDGTRFENPKPLNQYQTRLRAVDKTIARSRNVHGKNKRSNRRNRLYRRREELHRRIRDIRREHLHRITSAIAKRGYSEVKVETLNVKGMMRSARGTVETPGRNVRQKAGLSRNLADASMSEFLRLLEYKCQAAGTVFIKIDRWFASSKTCNVCGAVNKRLGRDRQWVCVCGARHDRDLNAAHNIRDWSPDTVAGHNGRGGDVSPNGRNGRAADAVEPSSKQANEAVRLAASPGQPADVCSQVGGQS